MYASSNKWAIKQNETKKKQQHHEKNKPIIKQFMSPWSVIHCIHFFGFVLLLLLCSVPTYKTCVGVFKSKWICIGTFIFISAEFVCLQIILYTVNTSIIIIIKHTTTEKVIHFSKIEHKWMFTISKLFMISAKCYIQNNWKIQIEHTHRLFYTERAPIVVLDIPEECMCLLFYWNFLSIV